MQTIQATSVPLWLSADGTTYKQLVCLKQWTAPTETQTTETVTFCGIALGKGIVKFNPTFDAVCEANPSGTQVTYADLLAWQMAGLTIWFKLQFPSPGSSSTNIFLSGQCSVTSLTLTGPVNDVIQFSGTLTGEGTLDTTP